MSDITDNGDNISFTVEVTNTGSVAGKDVVEVYSNPPYTNGGIEKASANLVQFEKTRARCFRDCEHCDQQGRADVL